MENQSAQPNQIAPDRPPIENDKATSDVQSESDDHVEPNRSAPQATDPVDQQDQSVEHPLDGLRHFTAYELSQMSLPEPEFVVDGLLPEGLTLLAAKPKVGKTLLAMGLAVAITTDETGFGTAGVKQGRVLFLALEGSPRGMKRRLLRMLDGKPAPRNLDIVTEFPSLPTGGTEVLLNYVNAYPDTRLIIVDTLKRVRGRGNARRNQYDEDYEALQPLTTLYNETDVSLLVIHHLNKRYDVDELDMVSGSTGLTGVVDNVLLMRKTPRKQFDARLHLIPREEEEAELALNFHAERNLWVVQGNADQFASTSERQEILDVLQEAGKPLGPKDISEKLSRNYGSVRYLLSRMLENGELERPERGLYTPTNESQQR